ncbi:MAG: inositol monophosphatase family protein [Bacteroidota bacterium]
MLDVAVEAAREAGAFLRESMGRVRAVETKQGEERNLVSEIDRGSEEMIIRAIRSQYPDHGFLAEESGGSGTSDYRWVIDPLDGTTNFLHGLPIYCVSIALEFRGRIAAGVVYDPNTEELFTAERGGGAFLNGSRMRVSAGDDLMRSLLVTGFPYDIARNPDHAVERFVDFLLRAQAVRRLGSAALDLAYVAAGRFEGFWEVNLQPWDMAAGILLVEESGGRVTDFSGNPPRLDGRQVLASNARVHDAMLEVLRNPPRTPPGGVPTP